MAQNLVIRLAIIFLGFIKVWSGESPLPSLSILPGDGRMLKNGTSKTRGDHAKTDVLSDDKFIDGKEGRFVEFVTSLPHQSRGKYFGTCAFLDLSFFI